MERGADQRHTLVHYGLIYFMLLWSQSTAFMAFLNNLYIEMVVVVLAFIAMFVKNTRHATYWLMFLACYLLIIMCDRLLVGGIGLGPWAVLAAFAVAAYWAVAFDPGRFVERFVKTVFFLACVSLVMFALQQVAPGIVSAILPISYDTGWTNGEWSSVLEQSVYTVNRVQGMILYTYQPFQPTRNVGIFSEPANYQIVLNITLWFVLYMRDRLHVSDRRVRAYVAILVVTILSTGSTSGYLVLSVQVLVYVLWGKDSRIAGTKRTLLGIGVAALVVLMGDWALNGTESVIQTVLINKLFGGGEGLDLSDSTGKYRVGTIELSIRIMAENPLGVGYETFQTMKSLDDAAGGGGGWFAMGAAEGILPFLLVPLVVYFPIIRSRLSAGAKLSVLFVCIYCSLAQSYAFMPLYVAVAAYCQFFLGPSDKQAADRAGFHHRQADLTGLFSESEDSGANIGDKSNA